MMSGIESSARIVPCFTERSTTRRTLTIFLDSVADTIKVLGKEVLKARKERQ